MLPDTHTYAAGDTVQGTWQGWPGRELRELRQEAPPLPAVHEELAQEEDRAPQGAMTLTLLHSTSSLAQLPSRRLSTRFSKLPSVKGD